MASTPCACPSPASAPLQQRLFEGPANRHHLAHDLSAPKFSSAPGNFSNCHSESSPPRSPASAQSMPSLLRDVVGDLVERVSNCQPRRNLRNRESSPLTPAPMSARPADSNLDTICVRSSDHRKLHIGSAGLHSDLAHHLDRTVAHPLIFPVAQRCAGANRNRIARMHAIDEILNRADDDELSFRSASFQLVFLPAARSFR